MIDQQQRTRPNEDPAPWVPKQAGPLDGPRAPNIDKPDTRQLIKRMKAIDSNQSKKFRQRSGE